MSIAQMKGFTLIEILIALGIFSILVVITSSSLYNAFHIRTRINIQANRFNSIQLAVSLIQQDVSQTIERRIRGNEMHLFPIFLGQPRYLEFTRDGNINPNSIEKRSTLKRIALLCKGGQLVRRSWSTLDPVNRSHYEDKILLESVLDCHFNYLNRNLQVLTEWQEQLNPHESLPKALQINIRLQGWGKLNLLFLIPGVNYASN